MSIVYQSFVRPLLFRMDPERVHNLILQSCQFAGKSALVRCYVAARHRYDSPRLRVCVAGLDFANPLGLAAGFDKNGHAIELLGSFGFGHVEIGSISAFPSRGNARPRLFRLPADQAIIVYYGVPNEGCEAVAQTLAAKTCAVPLGINLVKTNDPARPAVDDEVLNDYTTAFTRLQTHGSYISLNLSCPNSPVDRDFFDELPKARRLLERLAKVPPRVPVFLKLKPTRDPGVIREVVAIANDFPFVAGFGINLPAGKPAELELTTPRERLTAMPGAVSGKPVETFINANLRMLAETIGPRSRYTLMAAGGVFTAEDAYRKIRLGATLVQLYTGMVYHGPGVVKEILRGLVRLLERDGHASVADAVGRDVWK